MKLLTNKFTKPLIILFSFSLLIEIIFKAIMGLSIFDWALLRIILGLLLISGILSIILSFANKLITNIVISIYCLIVTLVAIAQTGFYNYFGTFMSIQTSSQAGAIGTFVVDFVKGIKPISYVLLIPFILLIVYFIFIEKQVNIFVKNNQIYFLDKIKGKKKKEEAKRLEEEKEYKQMKIIRITSIISIIVIFILYNLTITIKFMQNPLQLVSNKELIKNPSMQNVAVGQFGIIGYEIIDVKTSITGYDEEQDNVSATSMDIVEDINADNSRKIDDTKWIEANNNETNKNYKKLNNYFMNKTITPTNSYTGVFEDKNLIVIMLESGSNVLLDYPEYFPNINKLYNNGWAWDNAFSPRNSCSTGNNEMTGITSLHTINRECSANTYKNNEYFEAMFNLFNNKEYTTSSYHDYNDHFYYRHTYHPNMGSQKYYGIDELGIKLDAGYQAWPNDNDLIKKALPNFINQEKFMVWMTTVSSHMTYAYSSKTGDLYLSKFKDQKWSIEAKRYMSKLTIVDEAIGLLIDELDKAGKLDDTVIMLFADHEPYGLSQDTFKQIAKYDISKYGNVDRTPFIIYNSLLTPQKFDSYTTYINILPTLANLFNLDYDPRLYGGYDLLSDAYPNFVAFADGSWRNDKAYYDATSGKVTNIGDEPMSNEEVIRINTLVSNEIAMDNLAIKENYFKYLNKILNSDTTE